VYDLLFKLCAYLCIICIASLSYLRQDGTYSSSSDCEDKILALQVYDCTTYSSSVYVHISASCALHRYRTCDKMVLTLQVAIAKTRYLLCNYYYYYWSANVSMCISLHHLHCIVSVLATGWYYSSSVSRLAHVSMQSYTCRGAKREARSAKRAHISASSALHR
jgi:hypothetical protein